MTKYHFQSISHSRVYIALEKKHKMERKETYMNCSASQIYLEIVKHEKEFIHVHCVQLLFNSFTETVEVCWQFLIHQCQSSKSECSGVTTLRPEAVTPRRPACRVIYINLLDNYYGLEI